MTRYKTTLAYNGRDFLGWQSQKGGGSIQDAIEAALAVYCKEKIGIVGCGRTDSGVHARNYVMHFDSSKDLTSRDLKGLNAILPGSIAISRIKAVDDEFHARFHCVRRTYSYYLNGKKDPFKQDLSYRFHSFDKIDLDLLEKATQLITQYTDFYPFCKSHSGASHFKCQILESSWKWDEKESLATYTISANRFLRGMVRLLVGMQLNVALGKLSLEDVRMSLEAQQRLELDWSVPAHGLFLENVSYD